MKKYERKQMTIMDFSGVYREERFWENKEAAWVEARDIPGTNCYCDGEAMEELKKRIAEFPPEGMHFIDSGNYHYMSRIWLEKIHTPFRLLVFDNHTDMQLPAFGGLLSCGGWIAAALLELENLKEVILIGPDEAAYGQAEDALRERVRLVSRETLGKMRTQGELLEAVGRGAGCFWKELLPTDLPLYISIDKDVLGRADAVTTWSQGEMRLQELLALLRQVQELFGETGGTITGVDVCGEGEPGEDSRSNDRANREIFSLWDSFWDSGAEGKETQAGFLQKERLLL